jgi:hypothetical protein
MCLNSQLVERQLTTTTKTLWAPFNIQKSKVHVVAKHSTKTNCTYRVKVLFTNVRIKSLVKTFLDEKHILGHNQRINPWNQTNLIISDKKPLNHKWHYIFHEPLMGLMVFQEWIWGGKRTRDQTWGYILPFNCQFLIKKT